MSPTQRSLAVIKKRGGLYQIVEHFNIFAKVRQDLFKFIDILHVNEGKNHGIQVTSGSHHAERIKKIVQDNEKTLAQLKEAGWIISVHSWSKKKDPKGGKRMLWTLREEIL